MAFVPDRSRSGACVVPIVGHEPLRPVKSHSFEVLKRGTGRYELEVLVESRNAHGCPLRHTLNAEWLRTIGVDILQDPSDASEMLIPAGKGTQQAALLAAQHTIDNFPNNLATEHAAVERAP